MSRMEKTAQFSDISYPRKVPHFVLRGDGGSIFFKERAGIGSFLDT